MVRRGFEPMNQGESSSVDTQLVIAIRALFSSLRMCSIKVKKEIDGTVIDSKSHPENIHGFFAETEVAHLAD